MNRLSQLAACLTLLLLASGCSLNFKAHYPNRLIAHGTYKLHESPGGPSWGELSVDTFGSLTLNGNVLDLPHAQEQKYLGIHLVDIGELPVKWRPHFAKEGGIMVSGIDRKSPLAVAGVRAFDIVEKIQGAKIDSLEQAIKEFKKLKPHERFNIKVKNGGTERGNAPTEFELSIRGMIDDRSSWQFPFLFEWHTERGRTTAFDCLLFKMKDQYTVSDTPYYRPHQVPGAQHEFNWSALLGLIRYEQKTAGYRTPVEHKFRNKEEDCNQSLTLLWLIGIDLN